MSPAAGNETPESDRQRKAVWGRWLDDALKQRALRNTDFIELLRAAGAGKRFTSTALISQWRSGTVGPSETAALYVAKALGLPQTLVLRQAGHSDAADLIEDAPRDDDPRLARIRRSGLSRVAQDEAEGFARRQDRQYDELLDEYVRLLKRGEQLEQEEQAQKQGAEPEDSAAS